MNNDVEGVTVDNTVTNAYLFIWLQTPVLVIANTGPTREYYNLNEVGPGPPSPRSTVVYTFQSSIEKFKRVHEIAGEYNIINAREVQTKPGDHETTASSHYILVLGKQNSKLITTWRISKGREGEDASSANALRFDLYETLSFNVGIRSVAMFDEFGKTV